MLKKSEVLKEGYVKGLKKAASEIERILLTEEPMITRQGVGSYERKVKW